MTMGTTRPKWATFADIAKGMDVPNNTLRRWADEFADFLPSRTDNRVKTFASEAVMVFQRIHELFKAGARKDQVREVLAAEVKPTLDVAPEPKATTPATATTLPASLDLGELRPWLERYVTAFERNAIALEKLAATQAAALDALRGQNEALERRLAALEGRTTEKPIKAILGDPGAKKPANRAEVLMVVAELRSTGMGKKAIARELARRGTPTLSGLGKWHPRSVGRLFVELDNVKI